MYIPIPAEQKVILLWIQSASFVTKKLADECRRNEICGFAVGLKNIGANGNDCTSGKIEMCHQGPIDGASIYNA